MATAEWVDTPLWAGFKTLHEDIVFQILWFAGREASAAFRIACGKGTSPDISIVVRMAERAMLYEPFTFSDWHGYDSAGQPTNGDPHAEYEKKKKRLLWERERGFRANGAWEAYPTPLERWHGFKSGILKNPEKGKYVRRIAVASWMSAEDLRWIARNLTRFDALDLSDIPLEYDSSVEEDEDMTWIGFLRHLMHRQPIVFNSFQNWFPYLQQDHMKETKALEVERLNRFYSKREDYEYEVFQNMTREKHRDQGGHETFEKFFWRILETQRASGIQSSETTIHELLDIETQIAETHMLRRLKWIGVADWRSPNPAAKAITALIPSRRCICLRTICIRGEYIRDRVAHEVGSVHDHVCQFILGLLSFMPRCVTTLELRLSISFIRYFLELLHKRGSHIERVGIDLGAWVQIFPLETKLGEQEHLIRQPSFYRTRSGDVHPHVPSSTLQFPPHDESEPRERQDYKKEYSFMSDTHIDSDDCLLDNSGHHIYTINQLNKTCANTLPKMLEKLHLARHSHKKTLHNWNYRGGKPKIRVEHEGARLFPLAPESERRSGDPIHPLALTQVKDKTGFTSGSDYDGFSLLDLKAVYPWLASTFKWRPVFDWDWFMVANQMVGTHNPNLVDISSPSDWKGFSKPRNYGKALARALTDIKNQFILLNDANIPVHILIGRRNPDHSSCYWGWPYNEVAWQDWVESDFSTNLETITRHIKILSIFYDLRNPLDHARLWQIERRRPHCPPRAQCPRRDCPWKETRNCPFAAEHLGLHPRPQVSGTSHAQNLPNGVGKKDRHSSKPRLHHDALAFGCPDAPPTGLDAHDHSETDAHPATDPHYAALYAVFTREAFGWHRFWTTYATTLVNLTTLRVRMPASCDDIASWCLAKLVNRNNGWRMLVYADERTDVMTADDLVKGFAGVEEDVYERVPAEKVCPGGRFVRRSWVWDPLKREEEVQIREVDQVDEGTGQNTKVLKRIYTTFRFKPRTKYDISVEPHSSIRREDDRQHARALETVADAAWNEIETDVRFGVPQPMTTAEISEGDPRVDVEGAVAESEEGQREEPESSNGVTAGDQQGDPQPNLEGPIGAWKGGVSKADLLFHESSLEGHSSFDRESPNALLKRPKNSHAITPPVSNIHNRRSQKPQRFGPFVVSASSSPTSENDEGPVSKFPSTQVPIEADSILPVSTVEDNLASDPDAVYTSVEELEVETRVEASITTSKTATIFNVVKSANLITFEEWLKGAKSASTTLSKDKGKRPEVSSPEGEDATLGNESKTKTKQTGSDEVKPDTEITSSPTKASTKRKPSPNLADDDPSPNKQTEDTSPVPPTEDAIADDMPVSPPMPANAGRMCAAPEATEEVVASLTPTPKKARTTRTTKSGRASMVPVEDEYEPGADEYECQSDNSDDKRKRRSTRSVGGYESPKKGKRKKAGTSTDDEASKKTRRTAKGKKNVIVDEEDDGASDGAEALEASVKSTPVKKARGTKGKTKAVKAVVESSDEEDPTAAVSPPKAKTEYDNMTVVKLRAELKRRGIKQAGMTRKAQFVARLEDDDKEMD
ncbi:hypothetical protein N0V90_007841 [Kalmusia sp. IMI 367209]|nr:hypothetical protein N0V90_007841 [Kalmusia sp. IMI 367209]